MDVRRLTTMLVGVTPQQIRELRPAERQALSDQCERVHREIAAQRIADDAKRATAPRSGVLVDLRKGKGRE